MGRVDSLSVVVPVYNSAQTLPELIRRLLAVVPASAESWEIVCVNDGSRDESWTVLTRLAAAHAGIRGLDLMRNYGQHNALLAGIRSARGAVTVTIDDDLQHPPEAIPALLAALDGAHDVVYGTPRRPTHSPWRNLASWLTKMVLQGAMGVETAKRVSAFRAFRTSLRAAFADYRGPHLSIDVLLTWATTRFTAVPVDHTPRPAGASNYTVRTLMVHAMNMITGFTTWPLRLASLVGFGATAFGLLVLAYVVGRYVVEGGAPAGFPFLASIIAIFSGAQLFALGMVGEYLSRMHFRMMERPAYVVRSERG